MGRWSYTTYIKFTANVDKDMDWLIDQVHQMNGYVANYFVNTKSVAIETDAGGTPV